MYALRSALSRSSPSSVIYSQAYAASRYRCGVAADVPARQFVRPFRIYAAAPLRRRVPVRRGHLRDSTSLYPRPRRRYGVSMRDIGLASGRELEVHRDEGTGLIRISLRGTSDARSSADRDTRVRISMSSGHAARLWHALGSHLSEEEKNRFD